MGRLRGHFPLRHRLFLMQRDDWLEICACRELENILHAILLTEVAVEPWRDVYLPRVDQPRAHGAQVPALRHLRRHVHGHIPHFLTILRRLRTIRMLICARILHALSESGKRLVFSDSSIFTTTLVEIVQHSRRGDGQNNRDDDRRIRLQRPLP